MREKTRSTWRGVRAEPSGGGQAPLVAEVDDVPLQPHEVRTGPGGQPPGGVLHQLDPLARGHHRVDAGTSHPRVVRRLEPVVVGQGGAPVPAPVLAPGVLHEEPDLVVADERVGMAAERAPHRRSLDHRHPLPVLHHVARLLPPLVDDRRGGDPVELVDRRLHVVEPERVDAVERAERVAHRLLGKAPGRGPRRRRPSSSGQSSTVSTPW